MSEKITRSSVDNMAALGRLKLTKKEENDMAKKLQEILEYFATIQKIDTRNVPTTDTLAETTNVARKDHGEINEERICPPQEILEKTPKVKNNHIQVPGVFEEQEL